MPRYALISLLSLKCLIFSACLQVSQIDDSDNPVSVDRQNGSLATADRTLTLGAQHAVTLDRKTPVQAFTFTLSDRAAVDLSTDFDESGREVDTVISLYRERPSSWGPPIASSDDRHRSRFSTIDRELPAGNYRLQVKGFKRSSTGSFVLATACHGKGCPVRSAQVCLFGSTYHELRDGGAFEVDVAAVITPSTSASLSALQQMQLLAAVQVAYQEASDLESALGSVDQSEINRLVLRERATGRSFTAYEYGAGDNSYGAVFETASPAIAAQIQDGDLYLCKVLAP